MGSATLSTIFLFCDSDHNILKKRENLYMSGHVLQVKTNAQQQAFGKVQASQKKVFCDVEVCLLIVLNNL